MIESRHYLSIFLKQLRKTKNSLSKIAGVPAE
jgi:hypothetical protein